MRSDCLEHWAAASFHRAWQEAMALSGLTEGSFSPSPQASENHPLVEERTVSKETAPIVIGVKVVGGACTGDS